MHPRLVSTLVIPSVNPPHLGKALAALDACTPSEARVEAERVLARALPCGCCLSPRIHLGKYVGTTLFLDDDPAALRSAVPAREQRAWPLRLVAACIVLYGRARVTVFGRS